MKLSKIYETLAASEVFTYELADEEPEAVHYSVGDVQVRTIGNKIYLFRCIDEDYEDALDNSQKTALPAGW